MADNTAESGKQQQVRLLLMHLIFLLLFFLKHKASFLKYRALQTTSIYLYLWQPVNIPARKPILCISGKKTSPDLL